VADYADKVNGQQLDNSDASGDKCRIAVVESDGRRRTVTVARDEWWAEWEDRTRAGEWVNCAIGRPDQLPIAIEFGKLPPEQVKVALGYAMQAVQTAVHSRSKVAALHLTFMREGEAPRQRLVDLPEHLDGPTMSLVGIMHSDGSVTVRPTADLVRDQLQHLLENQTDHWRGTWGYVIENALQVVDNGRGRRPSPERVRAFKLFDDEVEAGRDPHNPKLVGVIARHLSTSETNVRRWRSEWTKEHDQI